MGSQNQREKTRVPPAFSHLETLTVRKMEMTHSLGKHSREIIMNKIWTGGTEEEVSWRAQALVSS